VSCLYGCCGLGLELFLCVIKKVGRLVLAVLDYIFHGSCRRVSKVLSMGLEPISKSAVHYLAKRVSEIRVAREPRYRRCIAVDETKLRVKKSYVYIWSAVDVDSKELLALEASYGRSSLKRPSIPQESIKDVYKQAVGIG
jgi:transposase-like protein